MQTQVWMINPVEPEPDIIARAAEVIRRDGLVAFPTETVYGLGANALSEKAVARIFAAKERPADDPIIVHLASADEIYRVVAEVPPIALELAHRFWPGPL
ncbi:MAG TPA: Sua5/YciO/YrdC/YwlC family protein, partial [Chloroflexi bacterium]|nr:Sua5/YciO/YrdC/YwlC family protein [Chloroflexota bacterium]